MKQYTPQPGEYGDFYAGYLSYLPAEADVLNLLRENGSRLAHFYRQLPREKHSYRYAEGKWSLKEVVGHLIDTERIMGVRALRIGRGDQTPQPGFEQDDYIGPGQFEARSMDALCDEYLSVRAATLSLLESFSPEALLRTGPANGISFSTRALFAIIAGHELHHERIVRERYSGV